MNFFLRTFFLGSVAAMIAATASADVYRSVDKDGRVTYSDQPSPSGDAKPLAVKPSGGSSAAPVKSYVEQEKDFRKRQLESKEAGAKQAKADEEAKIRKDNCAAARSQLATMQAGGRVYTVNANGEREFLDEEGLRAGAARAQQEVDKWCK